MKINSIIILLFGVIGCSIAPSKLEEFNSKNNSYSPAETIKCMQMHPNFHRPHPINKDGDTRESYDQGDCYDDVLSKNFRELQIDLEKPSIEIEAKENIKKLPDKKEDSIEDIDIEAIEEKLIKKTKKD
ncbi:MAG: hypothetical protein ACPG78_03625 [Gammaproteobacteria bacterium]|jgi:hypothetical protein|nr:hypothetical protein [Pseudomonadota bacterium]NCX09974.1 hypothetical protein [Pseudomonadota bacterium]NCX24345.1 hypothetical protein [Pseudomonadota bacterium]NCX29690.1 hypothetical protein [Pseudomonadota bacterium]NCX33894.1 hypothetical protein [Pseudomonadota bacterium]|tara:strand:- start:7274 stop:7660 length:387 start_codon:yes stop_codon:yes gene_type:complete